MRTINQTLHLQHHRHTGRVLHHKHTSYRGLAVVLVIAGVFMAGLNVMARAAADTLYSSSYYLTVTASNPAPIPSDPAVITSQANGYATGQAGLTVSGTCPAITPSVVIAIIDNGTALGSGPCDSNQNFSVGITLVAGTNRLIARVYTITYDAGHDSAAVNVTYTPSGHSQSQGGNSNSGGFSSSGGSTSSGESGSDSGSGEIGSTGNAGGTGTGNGSGYSSVPGQASGAPLAVSIDTPFVIFGPDLPAAWDGSITGGSPPYRVRIYWGDGNNTSTTAAQSGRQTFRHQYHALQPYTINFYVTDAAGTNVVHQYAAVTAYVPPAPVIGGSTTTPPSLLGGPLNGYSLVGLYGAYLAAIACFGVVWVRSHHQFAYAKVPVHRHTGMQRRPTRRHR